MKVSFFHEIIHLTLFEVSAERIKQSEDIVDEQVTDKAKVI